ncbi:PASTA domain-containing protein [Chryseosolibacter indicus]|uniref:PASTA domain-containing protein n=1 Tax=Chryseosolibacter indicus TaxID=2782351 RepID=A0ABS5VXP6_9BACT|nr:PASTA domain-containing protein [Chryseosolibacter indicus]MBT1706183.1 PASTA domain-containing protein [Chryseosolibacter indicus]
MKFEFSKKYNNQTFGGLLINIAIATFIIIGACVVYFYVYLPKVTNHGESITVPNVEGMPFSKVVSFLEDHDLRYDVNDSSYSAEYPPLTILKQVPAAGAKVKENRKIYLTINRVNPPTVQVPNLIDGSLINADAVLKGSELKRGKIELVRGPFLNVVKEMKIQGSTVTAGTRVPKGTIIDLVVMDGGSNTLPMPDVMGLSLEDAKIPLLGSNLIIGKITTIGDTTGKRPVIIKQNPAAQENIKVGDIVDLWIGEQGSSISDDSDVPDDLSDLDN